MAQLVRHWALVPLRYAGGGKGLGSNPTTGLSHEQTNLISYSAALLLNVFFTGLLGNLVFRTFTGMLCNYFDEQPKPKLIW